MKDKKKTKKKIDHHDLKLQKITAISKKRTHVDNGQNYVVQDLW